MRHLAFLLAAFLFLTAQLPASASLHKTSKAAYAKALSVHRPAVTLKARFNRTADHITAKILALLPPAFQPSPDEEYVDAPTNKMANIAFWCGIAGYVGFYPALPVALITGIIALNQIRDSGERGKGRAIAAS